MAKKPWTLNQFHNFAKQLGLTYVPGKTKSQNKKHKWICPTHGEFMKMPKFLASGCPKCKIANDCADILRRCKEKAESRGGQCLTTVILNKTDKQQWKCEHGHIWEVNFHGILYGTNNWCPHCSGNAGGTIEEIQEYAKSRNGICLSKEYDYGKTYYEFKCHEGHQWESRWDLMKHDQSWCPLCNGKKTIKQKIHTNHKTIYIKTDYHENRKIKKYQEVKDYVESKGGKLLSEEYQNRTSYLDITCGNPRHQPWKACWASLQKDSWCWECTTNRKQLNYKHVLKYAKKHNIKCLSDKYINTTTPMDWQCLECDAEWTTNYANMLNRGDGCAYCSVRFKSEPMCRRFLEEMIDDKLSKTRPDWLSYPQTGRNLELDGYNEDFEIAFEYNGVQHYEYVDFFHYGDEANFIKQQERDAYKYAKCKEKNVDLIIIDGRIYNHKNEDALWNYLNDEIARINELRPVE